MFLFLCVFPATLDSMACHSNARDNLPFPQTSAFPSVLHPRIWRNQMGNNGSKSSSTTTCFYAFSIHQNSSVSIWSLLSSKMPFLKSNLTTLPSGSKPGVIHQIPTSCLSGPPNFPPSHFQSNRRTFAVPKYHPDWTMTFLYLAIVSSPENLPALYRCCSE